MSIAGNIAIKSASKYRKAKAHEAEAARVKSVVTAGRRRKTASAPKPTDQSRQSPVTRLEAAEKARAALFKQVMSAARKGDQHKTFKRCLLLAHYHGLCLDLVKVIAGLPIVVEQPELYNEKNTGKAKKPLRPTSAPEKRKAKAREEQHTVTGTVKAGRSWVKAK